MGVLDFAGGTVVHVLAGVSALALLLILPKRHGYPSAQFVPHSVGWTLIGAAMLMVSWFGFNAGSAIAVGKEVESHGLDIAEHGESAYHLT